MDDFDRHIVLIRTSRMLNQGLLLKLRMSPKRYPLSVGVADVLSTMHE